MSINNEKVKIECDGKPKVAFVCNHNSCRSQIAEALGKEFGNEVFESYSAGTIIKNQINQDAVRLIKDIYKIDMEETQFNKKIDDIPKPDVLIFMGCNVSCPHVPHQYTENWELDDPSGKTDEDFQKIIDKIHENILSLTTKLS